MATYFAYLDFSKRGYITGADYDAFQLRYGCVLNPDASVTQIDPTT
jgi:hypothetical protein